MSESYSIYFEFFGIIIAWILCGYFIIGDVSLLSILGGVIHASIQSYKHVMNNN
jgi:hypothetical protein